MSKEDHELLEISCSKCKRSVRGTYEKLFGLPDGTVLPSLIGLPKMVCKQCGEVLCIGDADAEPESDSIIRCPLCNTVLKDGVCPNREDHLKTRVGG